MSDVIRGTVAQIIARNVSINGKTLTSGDLSMLTRLGEGKFCRKVGTADKTPGTRGRAATIWEIDPSFAVNITG